MRKPIFFFILVFLTFALKAQDLIITNSGESITSFDVEIGEKSVFYRIDDNENALFYRISKKDILVIKRNDGSILLINTENNSLESDLSKNESDQIEKITLSIPNSMTTFSMIKVEGKDEVFYIGETEVTQGMWETVMGRNSKMWDKSKGIGDNIPTYGIDWYKANEFCEKLSLLFGELGYSFTLPTYAQWLYAAHGGKYSKNYMYSGSNESKDVAWYKKNSGGKYHNVKGLKPNELGLYDMSGNVGEWCLDEVTARQKRLAGGTIDSSYNEVQISSAGFSYTEFKHGLRVVMIIKEKSLFLPAEKD